MMSVIVFGAVCAFVTSGSFFLSLCGTQVSSEKKNSISERLPDLKGLSIYKRVDAGWMSGWSEGQKVKVVEH